MHLQDNIRDDLLQYQNLLQAQCLYWHMVASLLVQRTRPSRQRQARQRRPSFLVAAQSLLVGLWRQPALAWFALLNPLGHPIRRLYCPNVLAGGLRMPE